jgi:uncharacterized protein YjeT (DUF2065 family)
MSECCSGAVWAKLCKLAISSQRFNDGRKSLRVGLGRILFMQDSIELFVALGLFVVGLSHAVQPDAWVAFFALLREKGTTGAFANGFLSLFAGAVIVSFHWKWQGVVPLLVTALGVGQSLKAAYIFIAPQHYLQTLNSRRTRSAASYRIAGMAMLVLALAILGKLALQR